MTNLTLIQRNGNAYIDSREVAELVGKRHHNLLRDIYGYINILNENVLNENGAINFDSTDFFVPSTYQSGQNKELPCFLITKMGCEMVANKLTGEKGILFTAAYVTRFNQLEAAERAEPEALAAMPEPRLGEINASVRIIVRCLKSLGTEPMQIMEFLQETYEPLGFALDFDFDFVPHDHDATAPHWYNANGIARECGLYSLSGKPHGQAAAALLNDILHIGDDHKRSETACHGFHTGISTLYDDNALVAAMQWLVDNGCPKTIHTPGRTYHVQYIQLH
jgi:Rha family phage regulatory protein